MQMLTNDPTRASVFFAFRDFAVETLEMFNALGK